MKTNISPTKAVCVCFFNCRAEVTTRFTNKVVGAAFSRVQSYSIYIKNNHRQRMGEKRAALFSKRGAGLCSGDWPHGAQNPLSQIRNEHLCHVTCQTCPLQVKVFNVMNDLGGCLDPPTWAAMAKPNFGCIFLGALLAKKHHFLLHFCNIFIT